MSSRERAFRELCAAAEAWYDIAGTWGHDGLPPLGIAVTYKSFVSVRKRLLILDIVREKKGATVHSLWEEMVKRGAECEKQTARVHAKVLVQAGLLVEARDVFSLEIEFRLPTNGGEA